MLAIFSLTDYEAVVKLSEDFNGADLRNVCTEAGIVHYNFAQFLINIHVCTFITCIIL